MFIRTGNSLYSIVFIIASVSGQRKLRRDHTDAQDQELCCPHLPAPRPHVRLWSISDGDAD